MKDTKLSELPIIPEQYGGEHFSELQDVDIFAHMTYKERCFIDGLIRYYEPQNILEIGVHRGEGTVTILSAISDIGSRLVSVDKATIVPFRDGSTWTVGELATKKYAGVREDKWKLFTGVDPSEIMEKIDTKFDFVVIDSGHYHPIEVLNFLSVLPWLNDGAVVVLHDISITFHRARLELYASRLLISAVCAEKLEPNMSEFRDISNIAAFQVAQDTRKYIQNVFSALMFPWEIYRKDDVDSVGRLIRQYYPSKQIEAFEMAADLNASFFEYIALVNGDSARLRSKMKLLSRDIVFYGGGERMKIILVSVARANIPFNFPIWDIKADTIKEIHGHKVTLPDFTTSAESGQVMVITVFDKATAAEIRAQFEPLGYKVYHGIEELLKDIE